MNNNFICQNISEREINLIIEELTKFARDSFKLLKPLIVKTREVELVVSFYNKNNRMDVYGYFNNNKITIFLSMLFHDFWMYYNTYDKYTFVNICKNRLLFTILHELHHVEQNINNFKYSALKSYKNEIENEVNYMSAKFILDNFEYLNNNLDIELNYDIVNTRLHTHADLYEDISYDKYEASEYYHNMFNASLEQPRVSNFIYNKLINDDQSSVYLIYNGIKYIIKDKGIVNEDFYKFDKILMNDIYNIHYRFLLLGKGKPLDMINLYINNRFIYNELLNECTVEIVTSNALPMIPLLIKVDDKNRCYI